MPDFLASWRRDQRRERLLSRGAFALTLCFVALYFTFAIALRQKHPAYLAFNLFALYNSLSRLVIYKRYQFPDLLPALRHPDPRVRAAACRALEAVRDEVLPLLYRALHVLPDEAALRVRTATCDDVAESWAALRRPNWPRIARVWLAKYLILLAFVAWIALGWVPPP